MPNYIYIATSLDGYIATPDDGIDWLDEVPNPDHSDFGFSDFMKLIDALVMGRRTFEKVLALGPWPYQKPVFVLSRSLTTTPAELSADVTLAQGEPADIVQALRDQGHQNLYIDGGQVIQSFLRADLIDEMILTRFPILLGDGIPLFDKLPHPQRFTHKRTDMLKNTLIKSWYSRARET